MSHPEIPKHVLEKVAQVRSSLDDMVTNARIVKGENYVKLAKALVDFNQVGQLMRVVTDPQAPDQAKAMMVGVIQMKLAGMLDTLRIALGVSDADGKEAVNLAELMTDQLTLDAGRAMRNGPPLQS